MTKFLCDTQPLMTDEVEEMYLENKAFDGWELVTAYYRSEEDNGDEDEVTYIFRRLGKCPERLT